MHLASLVEQSRATLGATMLDRDFRDRDFPAQDSITRSRLLPSMIVAAELFPLIVRFPSNIEVARLIVVFVRSGDREGDRARRQNDGVRIGPGVGRQIAEAQ